MSPLIVFRFVGVRAGIRRREVGKEREREKTKARRG